MTPSTNTLEKITRLAEFGGIITTGIGIGMVLIFDPAGRAGGYVASVGLILTCIGFIAKFCLSKHQKAQKAADDARIGELEERLLLAEDSINDPMHKMAVDEFASRYADEHQDDGR